MNSWKEMLGQVELWLLRVADETPPTIPVPGTDYLQAVEGWLQESEGAVHEACIQLASHQTLPPLSRVESFHLWARLDYAHELLLSLADGPVAMPASDLVLHWLLIGAWKRGRQRFLQRARDIGKISQLET